MHESLKLNGLELLEIYEAELPENVRATSCSFVKAKPKPSTVCLDRQTVDGLYLQVKAILGQIGRKETRCGWVEIATDIFSKINAMGQKVINRIVEDMNNPKVMDKGKIKTTRRGSDE